MTHKQALIKKAVKLGLSKERAIKKSEWWLRTFVMIKEQNL